MALSATNLLAKLGSLDEITLEPLTEARKQHDIRAALAAIRESRSNIDSFSRINAETNFETRLGQLEDAITQFLDGDGRG